MQQLAVVYFPKNDVEDINSFREKYDLSFRVIPPHITLISPLTEVCVNELTEHVANVVKNIKRFSIRLNGLSVTNDNLLFLLVKEGNEEFFNLHDKLYSGMLASHIPTDFTFVPHITLGDFQTKTLEFYSSAYKEAESINFDIEDITDEVTIIEGDGVTPPSIVKKLSLSDVR